MQVLIAEDQSSTRMILENLICKWGYDPVITDSGASAWEHLESDTTPRIALLDWMMPGIDGVEICRRLANRQNGPLVYTILLTGRNEKEDLVYALEQGAHDFHAKPVDPAVLHVRMKVGERLIEADNKLKEYSFQMEALAAERAQQLIHADRLATLGTMAASVAHELGNPLSFINGNVQLLENMQSEIVGAVGNCLGQGLGDAKKLAFIRDEFPRIIRDMEEGVTRTNKIAHNMKCYARRGEMESRKAECLISECVEQALALCGKGLLRNVSITTRFDPELPRLSVDRQQIEQVFVNLLTNASHAMDGQGRIEINAVLDGRIVRVTVADNGPGITEDMISSIWEPFVTTKGEREGTGLGLSIIRGIIKQHGGYIDVRNREAGGAVFTIELPAESGDVL